MLKRIAKQLIDRFGSDLGEIDEVVRARRVRKWTWLVAVYLIVAFVLDAFAIVYMQASTIWLAGLSGFAIVSLSNSIREREAMAREASQSGEPGDRSDKPLEDGHLLSHTFYDVTLLGSGAALMVVPSAFIVAKTRSLLGLAILITIGLFTLFVLLQRFLKSKAAERRKYGFEKEDNW